MSKTLYCQLRPFLLFIIIATTFALQSCGGNGMTNYHDRLIGEWQLSNSGDLQPFYNNKPYTLKSAMMVFSDDGNLETRILNKGKEDTWKIETGTWSVSQSPNTETLVEGEKISIDATDSPFNDEMYISFLDERTFLILLNELEYVFVKV